MKLAIVGAGKMGGAILTGALRAGVLTTSEVGVYHPDEARRATLAERYGVTPLDDDGVHTAERILIGVKPQAFERVAPLIARRSGCFISIMAGVPADAIARRVGSRRVLRAMPNLGARVRLSATALAALPDVSEEDEAFATALFEAVGSVHRIPESQFDAFTGLAGSGPAFAAVIAEALADGGVRAGFSRDTARDLAREVLHATAVLLSENGPADLKDEVASAGGTAIAGVRALEEHGARYAVLRAVEEAALRARALSREDEA